MRHFHWKTGAPCDCTFGPLMRMAKVAAKLDWLRARPDLQTPEGQAWLDYLERIHPDADALYPWLTREMKKNRIFFRSDGQDQYGDIRGTDTPGYTSFKTPHLRWQHPEDIEPQLQALDHGTVRHWNDWFNSNHPTRQGVDINSKGFQTQHMMERIHAWDQAMREQAEQAKIQQQNNAEVMHQWPDGWTVRKLGPEHLEYEGDKMGHCVGGYGYADRVRNGDTHIYSLRDPKGEPHATMELEPNNPIHGYGPWNGPNKGKIVQIQGKGNEVPNPEYQARLKDWFQTYPEDQRPNWDYPNDEIRHIGGIVPEAPTFDPSYDVIDYGEPGDEYGQGGYGPHGDYGLVRPQRSISYPDVIESLIRPRNYHDWRTGEQQAHDPEEVKALYQEALRRGEIPQLGEAVDNYSEWANDDFSRLEDQNTDYLSHYPGEEWDEDPEQLELEYNNETGREAGDTPEEKAETLQEYWQERRDRYDHAQNELYESHAPSQLTSGLYHYLNPHFVGGEGGYENQLRPQAQPQQPPQEGTTFSKVARRRPRKPHRGAHGKACYCPFGISGKFARRVQASKLDWLRERPDMQDEEGQKALKVLQRMLYSLDSEKDKRAADKTFPWLIRELRKGRLSYYDDNYPGGAPYFTVGPYGGIISGNIAARIGHYLDAKKKEGQGIDLMQHQAPTLIPDVETWHELQQEMEDAEEWRQGLGEVVHQWPDGWTIRQLRDGEEAEQEGQDMGNCVGSDEYGYRPAIDSGNLRVYSLRSPANMPHATIAIDPDGSVECIEDHSGRFGDKYAGRVNEWMDQAGDLSYEGHGKQNRWWDDYYDMDGPQNFRELVGHNHDNHLVGLPDYPEEDWWENKPDEYRNAVGDAENMGVPYDEHPELRVDDPNYQGILQSLTWQPAHGYYDRSSGSYKQVPAAPLAYNPEHGQYVLDHARQQGPGHVAELKDQLEELDDPYDEWRYQPDPTLDEAAQKTDENAHYRQLMADPTHVVHMLNHLMPQLDPSWEPYGPTPMQLHPGQQQVFQERQSPDRIGPDDYRPQYYTPDQQPDLGPFQYKYPQYNQPWINGPVYSKLAHPLYYRFVFSPMTGEVDLSHNKEADPKLHGEMAAERNEPGLVHGYAYRIGGGWRLFDWESRPLEDPYVAAQVMRKLRSGSEGPSQSDWEPAEQRAFSRFHHGMPVA